MALSIRPLTDQDLSAAGRIIRLAFGTFMGAPEPEQFWADMDYAQHPLARRPHGSLRRRTRRRAGRLELRHSLGECRALWAVIRAS